MGFGCPQPKKEENLIDYDLLKMNHLTLLIWMMNASSLLFVCDCWAATSTTMSSAEMATEDTRAEVIKDSSSTSSSAAAASVERKCFVCYSCKRVETSQSVPCSEDEDQCMAVENAFGEVDRSCSTEEKCQKEKTKPKSSHKSVTCCNSDDCNGGGRMKNSFPIVSILTFLALN